MGKLINVKEASDKLLDAIRKYKDDLELNDERVLECEDTFVGEFGNCVIIIRCVDEEGHRKISYEYLGDMPFKFADKIDMYE
ncbi:hypothetical protein M2150_001646 [Lachnospiraceae bacterium PM6-15]|uniref:hypothetical protein n=1 Tax=Ohessyouella blattaphilus TaxID=2949333 RepID=UPI003E2E5A13